MINLKPKKLHWLLRAIPNFLWPLKILLIRKSLKKCGVNFRFGPNSQFNDHRLIEIGNNVFFGDRATIACIIPVKIGNDVMFGPEVMIMGGDHNILEIGKKMIDSHSGGKNIPVSIEDDVWIGARVIILKGVQIKEGAVVGAGSLVTKNVLPYSINAGVPSKCIRCRFTIDELKMHLELIKSSYDIDQICRLYNEQGVPLKF